jgi:hypothetical protein
MRPSGNCQRATHPEGPLLGREASIVTEKDESKAMRRKMHS